MAKQRFYPRKSDIPPSLSALTARLKEQTRSVVNELRTIARHPRTVGAYLEERSPWLNRKFQGLASNLVEPFLVGMGLGVKNIGEDCVEVSLPSMWRNQAESGEIHTAAISAAGEFASRLFWEHHLDLRRSELRLERVETRMLKPAFQTLSVIFRCPVADREETLLKLRADGSASYQGMVSIYDGGGRLVAEMDLVWNFERGFALNPGQTGKDDTP